jgi:O-antigen/teichoic acid export membrane protein
VVADRSRTSVTVPGHERRSHEIGPESGSTTADTAVQKPPGRTPAGDADILRSPFSRNVAGIFGTHVGIFVLAFASSMLIAKLLGPGNKGLLVAVTTLPGMLSAIAMFGLPSAVNYFAGRGSSLASLIRMALLFTAVLSVVLVGVVWLALPLLESSFLGAARGHDDMLRVMLLTLPPAMLATFGGMILYGRQSVRTFNLIQLAQAMATLILAIVLIGMLGLGVWGGVASSVVVSVLYAVAVMSTVRVLHKRDRSGPPARVRALLAYGARSYPASLTAFFNYRADTYLIQALILSSSYPLGLYSIAVTMAEIVFYVPNSIGTIFLPRVAGSTVAEANKLVGRIGRLSMLLSGLVALALMPAAIIGVHVVLTAYVECLPAFFVLLPGVVSLSVAKVMTSYIGGRGRPGLISVIGIIALVLNIALNLVLIPRMGIVGASLASLISYSAHAAMAVVIASRLSGRSMLSLFVPGRAEVQVLVAGLGRVVLQIRSRKGVRGAGGRVH